MLKMATRLGSTAFIASVLLLAGCSNSSSDAPSSESPSGPGATATLSGVVFAKSACANVPVTVTGADGTVLARTQSDGGGNYTISFTTQTANPARLISASCPNADGSEETLISLLPTEQATGATETVNLNELANFRSALIGNSKDPGKLIAELASGALTIDAQKQAAADNQFNAMLLPLVKAAGLAEYDPVTMPMARQPAILQLLQTANFEFLPQSDGETMLRIRLKLVGRDDADGDPVLQIPAASLVDAGTRQNLINLMAGFSINAMNLVPAGMSALIDDLVARMNQCGATYSLPYGDARKTQACAAIYLDGDRQSYLNGGMKSFNYIDEKTIDIAEIDSAQQPLSYSAPSFEYLRQDGTLGMVLHKRGANASKAMSLNARIGADGKIGLSGDQYPLSMSVTPHAERRSFLHQPSSDYLSTGYRLNIPLQAKDGAPVTKVVVTPPASLLPNAAFTLLPGAKDMVLAEQDASLNETGNSGSGAFVRMRSEYVDTSISQRHPSQREVAQYFFKADLADAAIAAIAPQAQVWKADFYVGNSATPASTQYYRVPARPPTIAELRKVELPKLATASQQMIVGMLTKDPRSGLDITPLWGSTALTLTATGASPVYLSVHGMTTDGNTGAKLYFRDALCFLVYAISDLSSPLRNPNFAPRATTPGVATTVLCDNGLSGDAHCASRDHYANPVSDTIAMTGIELKAYPADPLEVAHFLSVLQLLP